MSADECVLLTRKALYTIRRVGAVIPVNAGNGLKTWERAPGNSLRIAATASGESLIGKKRIPPREARATLTSFAVAQVKQDSAASTLPSPSACIPLNWSGTGNPVRSALDRPPVAKVASRTDCIVLCAVNRFDMRSPLRSFIDFAGESLGTAMPF